MASKDKKIRKIKEKPNQGFIDENISKSHFDFVQKDEKIFDKKFDTKPIGYFRDAMTRFAKNKTNVYATAILFFMIFLSIIVPMTTEKRFTGQEYELRFLPPRVPIVERFGIMDGKESVRDQQVDRSTIDPETNLGVPDADQFNPELIDYETLENYPLDCTSREERCYGGQNRLIIESDDDFVTLRSNHGFNFAPWENPILEIEIHSLTQGGTVELQLDFDGDEVFETFATIAEPGKHQFVIDDYVTDFTMPLSTQLQFRLSSADGSAELLLDAINVYHGDTAEEPATNIYGQPMSLYTIVDGSGSYNRRNAEILMSSFRYDRYAEAFGERTRTAVSTSGVRAILDDNTEICGLPEDYIEQEINLVNHEFPEGTGCPILNITSRRPAGSAGDIQFYNYTLIVDYAALRGYDEIPYFYFGTDASGRDLFALSWIALRTSLMLGVVISLINITIGIFYGAIEGYYGGKTDLLMERFAEIIGRIPWLVTLSIFVALLGPGFMTLIFILVFSGWIGISSVTRTQFYRYKGREYVLASRTLGAKDSRLIFRHILPNAIGTIITASILSIPLVIFAESTISYLGFGIGHGTSFKLLGVQFSGVSIGVLMADGRNHMFARPYLTVFPAIIISILMITFNMFGNALRDAFNPSLRGVE